MSKAEETRERQPADDAARCRRQACAEQIKLVDIGGNAAPFPFGLQLLA